MAAIRLNRPLAAAGKDDRMSLETSLRATALLQKVVPILETAQVLHHKRPVASVGRLSCDVGAEKLSNDKSGAPAQGKAKAIERLHNIREQEWRVLRPGMERETRHLRWRK
ncbi:NADH-cytochrome b5 reductase, putative [Babesia ovata]|uniref:NADH-cytochrome b5 reductase, putative n=1 Tax=Babesia ovata TaxID=189622 RepID=A0A2H6KCF6_9APIC|nr:NADH-cytochrome b5 reductase, putative [Babesia ovata]GBE60664.1 NADH-cytochrome b5 reductase, putative [Babesia ovata]